MMRVEVADDEMIRRSEVEESIVVGTVVGRTRQRRWRVDVEYRERRGVREDRDGLDFGRVVVLDKGRGVGVDERDGSMDEEGDSTALALRTVFGDQGESRKRRRRDTIPKPSLLQAADPYIVSLKELRQNLDGIS